jgi:hemin uptake protein HemP
LLGQKPVNNLCDLDHGWVLTFNLNNLQQVKPLSTIEVFAMRDEDDPAMKTPPTSEPVEAAPAVIEARDLFRDRREIWIEHDGVRYRLRITRRNKLILQK